MDQHVSTLNLFIARTFLFSVQQFLSQVFLKSTIAKVHDPASFLPVPLLSLEVLAIPLARSCHN